MNWGGAITLTFVLFASFIGGMVYWMCRQRVDLVRDDYYQTEMAYQHQIDRAARTAMLNTAGLFAYEPGRKQILVSLPGPVSRGEITLYRPSDRRQDVRIPVRDARQIVSTARLAGGYWKIQVVWSDGQVDYFSEEELFIR